MSKYIQKFFIKKSSVCLCIILVFVCAIVYILCSYYLNLKNILPTDSVDVMKIAALQTIKEVLLIIISLFGANLFLNLLIECKAQNALVTDIIMNDVIATPEFYSTLSEAKQKSMYNALERTLYFKYDISHNMYQDIRDKLLTNINDYYFCKCHFAVSCNVFDSYIEKEVTRSLSLKSYEDAYIIHNYGFGQFTSKTVSGLKSCEIKSVEINGQQVPHTDYTMTSGARIHNLAEQNQYDCSIEYIYNKPITINSKTETLLCVKYVTRTSKDDRISTFRVAKPCKNFSLTYSVKQHEKYRIAVDAFGFLDNADDSANDASDSNVNICFSDWIFKYDGVTVALLDKK